MEHVPMAKAVEIEPLDSSDWEILELRAGHLEAVLLDQLFVLSAGQVSKAQPKLYVYTAFECGNQEGVAEW